MSSLCHTQWATIVKTYTYQLSLLTFTKARTLFQRRKNRCKFAIQQIYIMTTGRFACFAYTWIENAMRMIMVLHIPLSILQPIFLVNISYSSQTQMLCGQRGLLMPFMHNHLDQSWSKNQLIKKGLRIFQIWASLFRKRNRRLKYHQTTFPVKYYILNLT